MVQTAVHRLVAKAFLPNLDNRLTIHHKNKDLVDNRVENLQWVTHVKEKVVAKRRIYSRRKGTQVVQSALNGQYLQAFPTLAQASRTIGIPVYSIQRAAQRHTPYAGFLWKRTRIDRTLERKQLRSDENPPNQTSEASGNPTVRLANQEGRRRKIEQLVGNEWRRFDSITAAARQTGVASGAICHCASKKCKTAAGYLWRYVL
jgi:transposase-like protein